MPSRHIPSHAFDDILKDLGDDPAIPDPHGIRKQKIPKDQTPASPSAFKNHSGLEALNNLELTPQLRKFGCILLAFAFLVGLGIVLFIAYESFKTDFQASIEDTQKQLSTIKKEVDLLRNELQESQEDLYRDLDILEVSIHSLKENKATNKVTYKPQPIPHEAELRRWRYLGSVQIGGSHQAVFQVGKNSSTFEKGMLVLGDWRLNHIEKNAVSLTHLQGKSLTIKTSKSE